MAIICHCNISHSARLYEILLSLTSLKFSQIREPDAIKVLARPFMGIVVFPCLHLALSMEAWHITRILLIVLVILVLLVLLAVFFKLGLILFLTITDATSEDAGATIAARTLIVENWREGKDMSIS